MNPMHIVMNFCKKLLLFSSLLILTHLAKKHMPIGNRCIPIYSPGLLLTQKVWETLLKMDVTYANGSLLESCIVINACEQPSRMD